MKKIHVTFSYIITFFMFLSLYIFVTNNFLKSFLNSFYFKCSDEINMITLITGIILTMVIEFKYYTPTNHYFHDDNL